MFKKKFKKPSEFKASFKTRRRKVCRFCEDKVRFISYDNDRALRRFVNERGKIVPRRISGNCAFHQRRLTSAIKRARYLAIMPYTAEYYR